MLFSSSRLVTTPPSTAPKVWLRTSVPARKPAITQFAFASSSVTSVAVSPSAGSGPTTANDDALPLSRRCTAVRKQNRTNSSSSSCVTCLTTRTERSRFATATFSVSPTPRSAAPATPAAPVRSASVVPSGWAESCLAGAA